jgi:hypothetical protein
MNKEANDDRRGRCHANRQTAERRLARSWRRSWDCSPQRSGGVDGWCVNAGAHASTISKGGNHAFTKVSCGRNRRSRPCT